MPNFIKGKDLREQIRLSKLTFCTRPRKEIHGHFHAVCERRRPTKAEIGQAAERFHKIHGRFAEASDLVFRFATREHIPPDFPMTRMKFPPFKHIIVRDGVPVEVLRSHWKGTIARGRFCNDHGRITDELAHMILVMAHKYSMKVNWSSYSWREDMASASIAQLFEKGLKFDETKSSNVFAYWTTIIKNSFLHINDREKRSMKIKAEAVLEVLPHIEASDNPISDVVKGQLESMMGNPTLKFTDAEPDSPEYDAVQLEDDRPFTVGNRKFWSLAEASAETEAPMSELRMALLDGKMFRGQQVAYAEED